MQAVGRPLALQFEDDHTGIVAYNVPTHTIEINSVQDRSARKTSRNIPPAKRLRVGCAAMTQKRSCSRRNVLRQLRLAMSQTRMLLSSELERISSWRGWNSTQDTLL